MADAPWRCSQCGTVNEPVANACRTCGRWPSLFDLESSKIGTEAPTAAEDPYAAETVDVEELEPEVFEDQIPAEPPPELDAEEPEVEDEPEVERVPDSGPPDADDEGQMAPPPAETDE